MTVRQVTNGRLRHQNIPWNEPMKNTSRRILMAAVILALMAAGSSRAIAQVTATGFVVSHKVSVRTTPTRAYDALVKQVGLWWSPDHTFSGDSRNLSIDAHPGGCFCEKLPKGGGVEHLRVVYAAPGEILRMSGALGPLQASGVAGSLTWTLTASPDGATIELSYAVGGFIQGGFERIAPAVETVLGEQLQRLKLFIETGKPAEDGR